MLDQLGLVLTLASYCTVISTTRRLEFEAACTYREEPARLTLERVITPSSARVLMVTYDHLLH